MLDDNPEWKLPLMAMSLIPKFGTEALLHNHLCLPLEPTCTQAECLCENTTAHKDPTIILFGR